MLEDLIFNNKCEKEIKVGEISVTIKLIDQDELILVLESIKNIKDNKAQNLAYILELLSRSIIKVNGTLVNYNDNRKTIAKISDKILFLLYQEYEQFKSEIDSVLNEVEIKN